MIGTSRGTAARVRILCVRVHQQNKIKPPETGGFLFCIKAALPPKQLRPNTKGDPRADFFYIVRPQDPEFGDKTIQ